MRIHRPQEPATVIQRAALPLIGSKAVSEPQSRVSFANIMVATYLTEASTLAVEYALSFARYYGSKVLVAHVVEPKFGGGEAVNWLSAADLRQIATEKMKALEGNLNDDDDDEEMCFSTRIEQGDTREHLLKMAEQSGADLIVMGTHGLEKVDGFVLDSVAEGVLRNTSRPVLTIGPHVKCRPQYEISFNEIILATVLPPVSDRAARYAFSLAQEHKAHITLVHVLADIHVDADVHREMDHFKKEFEGIVPSNSRDWSKPEFVLEYGAAADAIVSLANDRAADLIVTGARREAALPTHFRESVAYKVIANAICPVLSICSDE